MAIYTIGYQGHSAQSFITTIRHHAITVLIDVRNRASSRNRSFNKSALRNALAGADISYEHLPALGVPADLRKLLQSESILREEYLTRYRDLLDLREDDLTELRDLLQEQRCCLMCVEHRAEECHRSALCEIVRQRYDADLEVTNI